VTGANNISAPLIQKYVEDKLAESSVGYISGRNIFAFDPASLESAIMRDFPRAKGVRVARDQALGNGLVVTLTERTPFALWCDSGTGTECFLIDETGVVFAPGETAASSSLATRYVFAGDLSTSSAPLSNAPYGEVFAGEHFSAMVELLKNLHDAGIEALGARLESGSDFTVSISEGFYLKVSHEEDPQTLAKNLLLILSTEALKDKRGDLEYVDLRFGNRVYYKFKGQVQAE
jgi:hypothetical protein